MVGLDPERLWPGLARGRAHRDPVHAGSAGSADAGRQRRRRPSCSSASRSAAQPLVQAGFAMVAGVCWRARVRALHHAPLDHPAQPPDGPRRQLGADHLGRSGAHRHPPGRAVARRPRWSGDARHHRPRAGRGERRRSRSRPSCARPSRAMAVAPASTRQRRPPDGVRPDPPTIAVPCDRKKLRPKPVMPPGPSATDGGRHGAPRRARRRAGRGRPRRSCDRAPEDVRFPADGQRPRRRHRGHREAGLRSATARPGPGAARRRRAASRVPTGPSSSSTSPTMRRVRPRRPSPGAPAPAASAVVLAPGEGDSVC